MSIELEPGINIEQSSGVHERPASEIFVLIALTNAGPGVLAQSQNLKSPLLF